jgi:hypothetical protein
MKRYLHKKLEDILIILKLKKYEKDKFFRIADEYNGLLPIEVLEGAYKGTVFTVKDIKVLDDYGKTKFDHEIIKKIPGTHASYYGEEFSKLVGEILFICIADAQTNFNDLKKEVLSDDTDGSVYFEEPIEERTVSKKGPTVSES